MSERLIIEEAARLHIAGEEFLIATVVGVRGAVDRRPGARMLLTHDRRVAGSVSGSFFGTAVARKCWGLTKGGTPAVVTYAARTRFDPNDVDADLNDEERYEDAEDGIGFGDDGAVDVLVERADRGARPDVFTFLEHCLRDQQRGALATVFRSSDPDIAEVGARVGVRAGDNSRPVASDRIDSALQAWIVSDASNVIAYGESRIKQYAVRNNAVDVLIESVVPPPRIFILGAGHDAILVAQLARTIGWEVIICATHEQPGVREMFAGVADHFVFEDFYDLAPRIASADRAAAIVMSHNYQNDRDALAMLLDSDTLYIGMIGPRVRIRRMLGDLGLTDVPLDDRLHTPVGFEAGMETPQSIALSVITAVQAAFATPTNGRRAGLR